MGGGACFKSLMCIHTGLKTSRHVLSSCCLHYNMTSKKIYLDNFKFCRSKFNSSTTAGWPAELRTFKVLNLLYMVRLPKSMISTSRLREFTGMIMIGACT
jgi:hypothetical protein